MPGVVFPTAATAQHTTDAHWEQELETVPCTGDAREFDQEVQAECAWPSPCAAVTRTDAAGTDEHHRAVFDGAPVGLQLIGQRWMEEVRTQMPEQQHPSTDHAAIAQELLAAVEVVAGAAGLGAGL